MQPFGGIAFWRIPRRESESKENKTMQIQNVDLFLDYLDKVHQRTMRVVRSSGQARLDVS